MKFILRAKRLLKVAIWSLVILLIMVLGIHIWVGQTAKPYNYSSVNEVPSNKVGLLLGTSKYLSGGRANLYYQYRLDAAEKLYRTGKIRYILISGDNRHVSYNEPVAMQKDLMARGIPADHIYLDYAGFRTFDSVIRAWKIFGQTRFTIISQPFHNQRALFIAHKQGLEAVGFNAKDVGTMGGLKTQIRERLARVKMLIDLYVTKEEPKFLGDPVVIPE